MKLRSCFCGCLAIALLGPSPAWPQGQKAPPRAIPDEVETPRIKTDLIDDLPQEFRDRAKKFSTSTLPATLEAMLAVALRSNPDLLLADIATRRAEAELNQTRLKVAHEVSSLFREREILLETAASYQGLS